MPISDTDPRDFFTAERSLLAWLRTGLSIMAIGFVVSRFGLFLESLAARTPGFLPAAHSIFSAVLGIAFVLVGTLVIFFAAVQHRRFVATLSQAELPRNYSTAFAIAASFCVAALGIVLAIDLLVSQPQSPAAGGQGGSKILSENTTWLSLKDSQHAKKLSSPA